MAAPAAARSSSAHSAVAELPTREERQAGHQQGQHEGIRQQMVGHINTGQLHAEDGQHQESRQRPVHSQPQRKGGAEQRR